MQKNSIIIASLPWNMALIHNMQSTLGTICSFVHLSCIIFIQVMINEGITELLFTSDNHVGLEKEFLSISNGNCYLSEINVIIFN